MPRISREAAAAKEMFVTDLYIGNPALTGKEVQAAVVAKFGGAMNSDKVKAIRQRVLGMPPDVLAEAKVDAPVPTPDVPETEAIFTPPVAVAQVAPPPVATTEIDPATIVTTPMEAVTDENGTHIRRPVEDTRPRRQIQPGLQEVVVPEV